MCEFCGDSKCTLTKKQVMERGAIIEDNTCDVMRMESEDIPQTYCFDGVPAFYSLSALIPDKDEESPHAYERYKFDEDTGCDGDWETAEIQNPLNWQTEKEFLEKMNMK